MVIRRIYEILNFDGIVKSGIKAFIILTKTGMTEKE